MREGILNYIAFKAIDSTESFGPQLCGILCLCECFIGLLSFGRAEYDNLSFLYIYFKAHRVTEIK